MCHYKILKRLTIEEGLMLIDPRCSSRSAPYGKKIREQIWGYNLCINSTKLRTYLFKGCKCYLCGKEADFFAICSCTEHPKYPSLELFRYNKHRSIIPFTQDHIIPLTHRGSRRELSNLQPTCKPCNNRRGDRLLINAT